VSGWWGLYEVSVHDLDRWERLHDGYQADAPDAEPRRECMRARLACIQRAITVPHERDPIAAIAWASLAYRCRRLAAAQEPGSGWRISLEHLADLANACAEWNAMGLES